MRYRYKRTERNEIVRVARSCRASGLTWRETFDAARAVGYRGSKEGLWQFVASTPVAAKRDEISIALEKIVADSVRAQVGPIIAALKQALAA